MKHQYITLSEGERQYDSYDFEEEKIVNAEYVKSKITEDNGNIYIEALPPPRTFDEVNRTYNKGIYFNYEEQLNWSKFDKLNSITMLRKLRYILPFHALLEEEFAMILRVSYRARKNNYRFSDNTTSLPDHSTSAPSSLLISKSGTAVNAGINLLGYSGCGKSASLEILLSNYPQVILHTSDLMDRITQIVYLVVVCPPNSNFKALYASIGREIDKALGNTTPIYENMINSTRTIGEKTNLICKLIEVFGIGCIIFDEIQQLDFSTTKESSFESLLTIVNKTNVAMLSVGTEDSYEKMFPNLRTRRRIGTTIQASQYCSDKRYFAAIVKNLMQYQWFNTYVEPTQDIVDALYEVTYGIIDQLISVYMYMQIDYVRFKTKPVVDGSYVRKISQKYYPGLKNLLDNISDPFSEKNRQDIINAGKNNLETLIEKAKQEEAKKDIINTINSTEQSEYTVIYNSIIKNIHNITFVTGEVYNTNRIEEAATRILSLPKNKNLPESELTKLTYSWLKRNHSDRRSSIKKRAVMDEKHIALKNDLLNSK